VHDGQAGHVEHDEHHEHELASHTALVQVSGYLTIRNIRRLFYGIWIYLDHPPELSVSTRWQNSHYPVNPDGAGASRIHALMHEHYEHDEHDESALSSLAEHHEHDEHAEHAVVGCIPAIAFRSIDSMNGIPAILCLVGLVSCIRCVLYRVSTCTRNTIAQSPMLTSYKQTHSAAIHVHRRSARVIRLRACNDLTKTARSVASTQWPFA